MSNPLNPLANPLTNPLPYPTDQKPRFTVEGGVWLVVAVLALVLRLVRLDAAPLNGREAHEAMLAWRAVTGQGMPAGDYSPVLLAANGLVFALCGASDWLARLWPALLGSALALTPLLLRRHVGRLGALAAGLYLAFSPTVLLASRQLDGSVVAAAAGMAVLGGLVRLLDTNQRRWLSLATLGLALAVTSSPSAYGLLLPLGLSGLVLGWVWPGSRMQHLHTLWRSYGRYVLLVFLVAALALATGLGWNLAGLGAAGDMVMAWLARFGPVEDPVASPLALLAVYEPLGLLFGVIGLVWAVRRGHRFGALLGLWAGLGALVLALMPGRTMPDTLGVLLPLALLAGVATEWLVHDFQKHGAWLSEGLYTPVVVVLWVHFFLMLAHYGVKGRPEELALAFLTAALQVLLALIFALAMRVDGALRALGVGTGIVLLAITLSAAWGGAYARPADPTELLVREPAAVEVRDLVQTLRDLSWQETGIPKALSLTLEAAPDSVLAWYLRDFSAARRVDDLEAIADLGQVLVTERRELSELGDVEYVGQDFALRRHWDPLDVECTWEWPPRCHAAVKWWLFRSARTPAQVDQWAVLWLREEGLVE